MRKTKVYRPRRGLRLSNGRVGVSPPASFVGGAAITRTRPTTGMVNLTTHKVDSVVITGSVQTSGQGPTSTYSNPARASFAQTSSLYLEGAVSTGRRYERRKLNATLLGQPVSAISAPPWPSRTVMDNVGGGVTGLTGNLESPSWTHASVGFNQAFVGMSLTSSFIETRSMNYFSSGTQPLEVSAVPASGNLFFSKESRYTTIVVKHTASFFDTVVPPSGAWAPATFAPGTGALISSVTSSNGLRKNRTTSPATIFVSVPVSGRLVDIKVWVELTHLSASSRFFPLGVLGVALRSPNVQWGISHPIPNDPQVFGLLPGALYRENSGEVFDFYRDTFLLWEGGNLFGNDTGPQIGTVNDGGISAGTFNGARDTKFYPTWQNDRSMRTIFSDGAPVPNPRMLYSPTSPSGNFVGAPNAYTGTGSSDALGMNTAYGNNVPWTSDRTSAGAGDPTTFHGNGSPPKGWLNGPAQTADVNEWPTTGFNYGAPLIRPLYPLLDPISSRKTLGSETAWNIAEFYDATTLKGFRPGLRGTEISGTWQLVLANNRGNPTTFAASASMDCYFRQVRLEITYESHIWSRPVVRRSETRRAPLRAGERSLYRISGSGDFGQLDFFVNRVVANSPTSCEVGRTFGLVLNSGSVGTVDGFALLYRLTGTLANLSGSAPGWLTNNFMGMPAIPISSASLSPPPSGTQTQVVVPFGSVIAPQKTLDGSRRLRDVATTFNPPKTLVQLAADFVSGSAT